MPRCFRDKILDFIYPARCPVCDGVLPAGSCGICAKCMTRVEYIREPKCCCCGKPLETEEEFCGDCKGKKHSFCQGNALFFYDRAMQESVARFKYSGRREYGAVYARELYRHYGEWIKQTGARMLVPVPVHRSRLRKRGYNQAELIARHLSVLTDLKMVPDLIVRTKETTAQKELSAAERLKNLEGAFQAGRARERLNHIPECVIIIDDIYTTGSTMEACSRVLLDMGVSKIYFLCVCIGKGS